MTLMKQIPLSKKGMPKEEGFLRLAKSARETTLRLMDCINAIPGLFVLGDLPATVFAFGADSLDIYRLADVLSEPMPEKRELGKLFGADHVTDPRSGDLRQKLREWTGGIGFEMMLECSGVAENVPLAFELVAAGGSLCMISIVFKGIVLNQPMVMNFKGFRYYRVLLQYA